LNYFAWGGDPGCEYTGLFRITSICRPAKTLGQFWPSTKFAMCYFRPKQTRPKFLSTIPSEILYQDEVSVVLQRPRTLLKHRNKQIPLDIETENHLSQKRSPQFPAFQKKQIPKPFSYA
jgi:hypothetical protein